ncbi:MAG: beta-glucanase (GH16 family) [bacterium]|jgi:beta-glucanase (GH16 family)
MQKIFMKCNYSLLLPVVLTLTLGACSSDSTPSTDEPGVTTSTNDDPGASTGASGDVGGSTTGGTGNAGNGTAGDGSTDSGTTGGDGGNANDGSQGITLEDAPRVATADLPPASVPVLDPLAQPIPGPNAEDFFGSLLETDPEPVVAGGPPTQPKNLRLDLVSNDWSEFSWAAARDDTAVVQYNIYRSDGVIYTVRGDQTDPASGSQDEIDKFWNTTSFIDCNYTRFSDRLHTCSENSPEPGRTYQYEVTAVDDDGMESAASAPLSITYLDETNAAVPKYSDPYKGVDDHFTSETDLSAVDYFLNDFDLVFSDEFNGTSIDPNRWQTRLTWGDAEIINGEQQYFVNTLDRPDWGYEPFTFTGESLIINAIPIPDNLRANLPPVCDEIDPTGLDRCEFLSGALSTHDRFQFIYGYTEGRFKVSGVPGALSSFYLYHRYAGNGVNYHAPEIDIIEYLGENPFGDEDAFQTYHFGDPNTGITRSAPTMSYEKPSGGTYADNDEWHTFGVLWEPQLVIWYINGREVKRLVGPQVSRQPMNIVNYLVAGSGWAPTPDVSDASLFPIQFEADYIRVYQRDAFKDTVKFGP